VLVALVAVRCLADPADRQRDSADALRATFAGGQSTAPQASHFAVEVVPKTLWHPDGSF